MSPKFTQHKISSFGELLDFLHSGNKTIRESLEFDVSVGREEDGSAVLEIGHPVDLRKRHGAPIKANELFEQLSQLHVKQLVIDVKARRWNPDAGRAEFDPGDQECLYTELPQLLATYLNETADNKLKTEMVVASVQEEFFQDAQAQGINFGKNVKTRFFARDTSENPLQDAIELGVNQVGLEFPKTEKPTERLAQLQELASRPEYADLEISFYTVDAPENAEIVREFFPDAEIITNVSSLLEKQDEPEKEISRIRE